MKTIIIIAAALFLFSCTKSNQAPGNGLHASLSITPSSTGWTLTPAASSGPITTWTVRMYEDDGTMMPWGPNKWVPETMYFGTNYGGFVKATLIVSDANGNSDSTVVNQQF
jgi:hypothetical protein